MQEASNLVVCLNTLEHYSSFISLSYLLNLKSHVCSIGLQISKVLKGDADVIKRARVEINASKASELLDEEACPPSNLQSHLNLALLDVEDDTLSLYSVDQNVSLEDYLRGRWSRSSSFD
jgi:hypothetical protein